MSCKPQKGMEEKLKCTLLSEGSQSEKRTYYMMPTIRHFRKGQTGESKDQYLPGFKGKKGGMNRLSTVGI